MKRRALYVLLACAGCVDPETQVNVRPHWKGAPLADGGLEFSVPLSVVTLQVQVQGRDMDPISTSFDLSDLEGTATYYVHNVPPGEDRVADVLGLEEDGWVAFHGSSASLVVVEGGTHDVDVEVAPTPGAAGAEGASPLVLSIDGGAPATRVVDVSLVLSAQGVGEMTFSNELPNPVAGCDELAWQPYRGSAVPWTLAGTDGDKTVYALVRDAAGYCSRPIADVITLDRAGPTLNGGLITVSHGAPGVEDELSGAAGAVEPGATVELFRDSAVTVRLGAVVAAGDGAFGPLALGDNFTDAAAGITAGQGELWLRALDALGNTGTPLLVSTDVTPPAVNGERLLVGSFAAGSEDTLAGDGGCAEPGASVEVYADAALTDLLGSAQVEASGGFAAVALGDNHQGAAGLVGQQRFWVRARDTAGNSSAALAFTVDVTPAALAREQLVVSSNPPGTDDLLSGGPGAAEPGSLVALFGAPTLAAALAQATAEADGSFGPLSLGDNHRAGGQETFWVRATDPLGNVGEVVTVTTDVTPPSVDGTALAVASRARGSQDGVSGGAGAAEPGGRVSVFADAASTQLVGGADAGADGGFGEIALGDNYRGAAGLVGRETFWIRAADAAGNLSAAVVFATDVAPAQLDESALATTSLAPGSHDAVTGAAGATEAGAVVTLYAEPSGGSALGQATAAADGSFGPLDLGDNHTVGATFAGRGRYWLRVADALGNAGSAVSVATDVTPPTVNGSALAIGSRPAGSDDTLAGGANAAEAGGAVEVFADAALTTLLASGAVGDDGGFAALAIGDNYRGAGGIVGLSEVWVRALDAAGNASAGLPIATDLLPAQLSQAKLTVTSRAPGSDDEVSGAAGATEAGATVELFAALGGEALASAVAGDDGSFAALSLGDNHSGAGQGEFWLRATDALGNVGAALAVSTDVTPPSVNGAALVVTHAMAGLPDEVEGAAGAAEPGGTVEVYADPSLTTPIGGAAVAADGSFPPVSIGDNHQDTASALGQSGYWVRALDAAGNAGAALLFTTDLSPALLVLTKLVVTSSPPGTADTVAGDAGATDPGATVELYADAGLAVLLASAVADDEGGFAALALGDNHTGAAGSVGQSSFWLRAIDVLGNLGPAVTVVTDVTPPVLAQAALVVDDAPAGSDDGVRGGPGAAEAGGSVELFREPALATLLATRAVAADGSFAGIGLGDNHAGAGQGGYYARAVDAAGNAGSPVQVTLDVAAPALVGARLVVTSGATDGVTGGAGATEAGATVRFYRDDALGELHATVTAGADGGFARVDLGDNHTGASGLAGQASFWARATDALGNTGAALLVSVDVAPPLLNAARLQVSSQPAGTHDVLTGLGGAAEAGGRVELYRDAALTDLLASADVAGDGGFTALDLGDNHQGASGASGQGTFYLRALDAAGNASGATTVTTDVAAPSINSVSLAVDSRPPGTDDAVSGQSGATEAGATVTLFADAALTVALASVTADAGGGFAALSLGDNHTTPAGLVGQASFWLRAHDALGNVGAPVGVSTDVMPPSLNGARLLVTSSPAGSADTVTAQSGAAEAGGTLRIYDDSALTVLRASAAVAGDGSTAPLSLGDNYQSRTALVGQGGFWAQALDAAGNAASGVMLFTDVTPPQIGTFLLTVASNPPGTDDTVTGAAESTEADASVSLYADGATEVYLGSIAAGADGAFGPLSLGDNYTDAGGTAGQGAFWLRATDALGNVGPTVAAYTDVSPPSVNGARLQVTSNPAGTPDTLAGLGGAAENGGEVRVFADGALTTLVASAPVTAGGVFAAVALGDNYQGAGGAVGQSGFWVQALDAAGNASGGIMAFTDVTAAELGSFLLTVGSNPPGSDDTVSGAAGSTEAGATVRVYADAAATDLMMETTADAAGAFGPLALGDNHTTPTGTVGQPGFWLRATDPLGNVGALVAVYTDVSPPFVNGSRLRVTSRARGSDDDLAGDSGAAEAGGEVRVYADAELTDLVGGEAVGAGGEFAAIALGDNYQGTSGLVGRGTWFVQALDAAGNASNGLSVATDVTPAQLSLARLRVTSRAPGSDDEVAGDPAATEAGAVLELYGDVELSLALDSVTAEADGSFGALSLGDNYTDESRAEQVGQGTYWLLPIDALGNAGTAVATSTDVVPPAVVGARLAVSNASQGSADTVSGVAAATEGLATVHVFAGDGETTSEASVAAAANGAFGPLALGDNHATDSDGVPVGRASHWLRAEDAAGNVGPATLVSTDVRPPALDGAWLEVGSNGPGDDDTLYGHAGFTDAGAIVQVYADAALTNLVNTATADLDGGFTWLAIGDNHGDGAAVTGQQRFWVRTVDAYGNRSTAEAVNTDVTPPPLVSALLRTVTAAPGSDDAVYGLDGVTEPDAALMLYSDAAASNELLAGAADADGAFPPMSLADNHTDQAAALAAGQGSYWLRAFDAAGNASVIREIAVDLAPPSVSISELSPELVGAAVGTIRVDVYAPDTLLAPPTVSLESASSPALIPECDALGAADPSCCSRGEASCGDPGDPCCTSYAACCDFADCSSYDGGTRTYSCYLPNLGDQPEDLDVDVVVIATEYGTGNVARLVGGPLRFDLTAPGALTGVSVHMNPSGTDDAVSSAPGALEPNGTLRLYHSYQYLTMGGFLCWGSDIVADIPIDANGTVAETSIGDNVWANVSARQLDAAGNDACTVFEDPCPQTDACANAVELANDTYGPTVSIAGAPESPTSSTAASFGLGATEQGPSDDGGDEVLSEPVTLFCRLDDAEFAECSGTVSYSGLALGGHAFEVYALDALANASDVERHEWRVQNVVTLYDGLVLTGFGADGYFVDGGLGHVFVGGDRLRHVYEGPADSFTTEVLYDAPCGTPRVAFAGGEYVVVFTTDDGTVVRAAVGNSGDWALEIVAGSGGTSADGVDVAFDGAGQPVVVYNRCPSGFCESNGPTLNAYELLLTTRTAPGAWSAPELLAEPAYAVSPRIAFDGDDDLWLAYQHGDDYYNDVGVFLQERAGGLWQSAIEVGDDSAPTAARNTGGDATDPRLALLVLADGLVAVAYRANQDLYDLQPWLYLWDGGGATYLQFGAGHEDTIAPAVAPDGDLWLASQSGTIGIDHYDLDTASWTDDELTASVAPAFTALAVPAAGTFATATIHAVYRGDTGLERTTSVAGVTNTAEILRGGVGSTIAAVAGAAVPTVLYSTPAEDELATIAYGGGVWQAPETARASLGNRGIAPRAVTAANGDVWIAHQGSADCSRDCIVVERWDGVTWSTIGTVSPIGGSDYSYEPRIAVGEDDEPVVVYRANYSGTKDLWLSNWDGAAFTTPVLIAQAAGFADYEVIGDANGTTAGGEYCVVYIDVTLNVLDMVQVKPSDLAVQATDCGAAFPALGFNDPYHVAVTYDAGGDPVVVAAERNSGGIARLTYAGGSWTVADIGGNVVYLDYDVSTSSWSPRADAGGEQLEYSTDLHVAVDGAGRLHVAAGIETNYPLDFEGYALMIENAGGAYEVYPVRALSGVWWTPALAMDGDTAFIAWTEDESADVRVLSEEDL